MLSAPTNTLADGQTAELFSQKIHLCDVVRPLKEASTIHSSISSHKIHDTICKEDSSVPRTLTTMTHALNSFASSSFYPTSCIATLPPSRGSKHQAS
ncbi:hypothetical protein MRB53_038566 [Persea americana]|nr:hypothetical protein MRB53_038566 [Persea americana]